LIYFTATPTRMNPLHGHFSITSFVSPLFFHHVIPISWILTILGSYLGHSSIVRFNVMHIRLSGSGEVTEENGKFLQGRMIGELDSRP
jgi:hypothetical protein